MKNEQRLWAYVSRVMGNRWKAQRHEDRLQPDVPDVSYACGGVQGWLELKVVTLWPREGAPFDMPLLTSGQRNWLIERGRAGGRCFVLARVCVDDYVLIRWDQINELGVWDRSMWLWYAYGFWHRSIDPDALAYRLCG